MVALQATRFGDSTPGATPQADIYYAFSVHKTKENVYRIMYIKGMKSLKGFYNISLGHRPRNTGISKCCL